MEKLKIDELKEELKKKNVELDNCVEQLKGLATQFSKLNDQAQNVN